MNIEEDGTEAKHLEDEYFEERTKQMKSLKK